mgnify:CR=1 FL=1
MLVTNTMEATASTTDSCQVSEPVTAHRNSQDHRQLTPPQHRPCTWKSLRARIRYFSIIGFAVAYIAALIINRIIKTRKTHH